MYGAESLRALIRHHVAMAGWLADQVRACMCVWGGGDGGASALGWW
jgi:hypothetical protein